MCVPDFTLSETSLKRFENWFQILVNILNGVIQEFKL